MFKKTCTSMSRVRNAVITSWMEDITYNKNKVKYIVYHREVAPETKKLHYHIYVELKSAMTYKAIKKMFNDKTIHIEPRKGTVQQAINYLMEDKNEYSVIEWGKRSKQGFRSDLRNVVAMIEKGKKTTDIIAEYPDAYIKYHKGFANVKFEMLKEQAKEWRSVKVHVLVGDAGSGKTRYVMSQPNVYKIDAPSGALWFDGYNGEKTLLLDDFYGWIRYGQLLALLDGYQLRLDIKGSHTWAFWDTIYITSNKPPCEWYKDGLTPALKRRITTINTMENNKPCVVINKFSEDKESMDRAPQDKREPCLSSTLPNQLNTQDLDKEEVTE